MTLLMLLSYFVFAFFRTRNSIILVVMCVLTEAPRMPSMLRSARVMEDWRKFGNSPEQKTWTSAQPVCA